MRKAPISALEVVVGMEVVVVVGEEVAYVLYDCFCAGGRISSLVSRV